MNKILTILLLLLTVKVFAASPTFQSFNGNQFTGSASANTIAISSGTQITNLSGYNGTTPAIINSYQVYRNGTNILKLGFGGGRDYPEFDNGIQLLDSVWTTNPPSIGSITNVNTNAFFTTIGETYITNTSSLGITITNINALTGAGYSSSFIIKTNGQVFLVNESLTNVQDITFLGHINIHDASHYFNQDTGGITVTDDNLGGDATFHDVTGGGNIGLTLEGELQAGTVYGGSVNLGSYLENEGVHGRAAWISNNVYAANFLATTSSGFDGDGSGLTNISSISVSAPVTFYTNSFASGSNIWNRPILICGDVIYSEANVVGISALEVETSTKTNRAMMPTFLTSVTGSLTNPISSITIPVNGTWKTKDISSGVGNAATAGSAQITIY